MSDEMTRQNADALRKPFEPRQIGQLPKPYKADSQRGNCAECGGYHGLPAVHLDYVGHAATTDRLLQVDPAWTWEPFAIDANGLPALDGRGNLWIRLTVCGVTRIGVGDGKSLKECIGDALRNAAMRFGVALDLWAKEDLHAGSVESGKDEATVALNAAKARVKAAWETKEGSWDADAMGDTYKTFSGGYVVGGASADELDAFATYLNSNGDPS